MWELSCRVMTLQDDSRMTDDVSGDLRSLYVKVSAAGECRWGEVRFTPQAEIKERPLLSSVMLSSVQLTQVRPVMRLGQPFNSCLFSGFRISQINIQQA